MSDSHPDMDDAVAAVHEDIPHRFQVSLTMSMDVRDDIRAIREELKKNSENQDVTTNDVMRLALIAASQYHTLAADGTTDSETLDEDQLRSLTALINRVVDEESHSSTDQS